jgi:hypothetical protein
MIKIPICHVYKKDELALVPFQPAQIEYAKAYENGWVGMQTVDVMVNRRPTKDLLKDFLKVNEEEKLGVIGYNFSEFPSRIFVSKPNFACFTADMESCIGLALGGRSEQKVNLGVWHVHINNSRAEEIIGKTIQKWKEDGIDEIVGGLRGGDPNVPASQDLAKLLFNICERNGVRIIFNETCEQRGWVEKKVDGVLFRIPDRSPLGIMATPDFNIQFYKGVAAGVAQTQTRNAFDTPPGVAGPAYLLMRRANGKDFENQENIARLKAEQRRLITTANQLPLGSTNIAGEVKDSNFQLEAHSRAQTDLWNALSSSFYDVDNVLSGLWTGELRKKIAELDLEQQKLGKIVTMIATAAVSFYGKAAKCYQCTLVNLFNQKQNLSADNIAEEESERIRPSKSAFRTVTAGDHGWLEVMQADYLQGESAGSGQIQSIPRNDDIIDDSWSKEKVVGFREDTVYPSSAKCKVEDEFDAELVEKLSQCAEILLQSIKTSPVARTFFENARRTHNDKNQISQEAVLHVDAFEQQGLPVSQTNFLFSERPSLFKSDFRSGARVGLAKMTNESEQKLLAVATRIGRDWGWNLGQAEKNAPKVIERAHNMAQESVMRRKIVGRENVFDDVQTQLPETHLQMIAHLSNITDTDTLQLSLWRVRDDLQQESCQKKLDASVSALCQWWNHADVPVAIHAQVFSMLSSDLICDKNDINMLYAVFKKLPLFISMGAPMAPMVVGHLKKGLEIRKETQTPEILMADSQNFKNNVLPEIHPLIKSLHFSNEKLYDHAIVPLLNLFLNDSRD